MDESDSTLKSPVTILVAGPTFFNAFVPRAGQRSDVGEEINAVCGRDVGKVIGYHTIMLRFY